MSDSASKGSVLAVMTLAGFLTPFMGSSINVALPVIGREFAMDAVSLTWVATSYLLASAAFLVPMGRVADIYGRKRVFLYGMALYSVAALLCASAGTGLGLVFLRVVQGAGASMIFGTSTAILTSAFPSGERGRALGINVAAVYAGLSLGPFIGGLLTEHLGWRSLFVLIFLLGVVVIAYTLWKLKGDWMEAKGERLDITGSVLYGVSLFAVIYGFSLLPRIGGGALVLAGVIGLAGFIRWEMTVPSPVLHIGLIRTNRAFAFSNLAALINYSATAATGFLLSLYLQYIREFTPQQAGLILLSQPVVMAAFSPFAGRLSDRVEPRAVASLGMALTAGGLGLFALLDEATGLLFIVGTLGLLGLGFALFSSPNTNAIMSSVERRYFGVASSAVATMRLTGQMLSLGIAALIFALFIGQRPISSELHTSFIQGVRVAFLLFGLLCACGVFASYFRGKVR